MEYFLLTSSGSIDIHDRNKHILLLFFSIFYTIFILNSLLLIFTTLWIKDPTQAPTPPCSPRRHPSPLRSLQRSYSYQRTRPPLYNTVSEGLEQNAKYDIFFPKTSLTFNTSVTAERAVVSEFREETLMGQRGPPTQPSPYSTWATLT